MSRLASDVRAESYALHVRVDPRQERFSGELRSELQVPAGTRSLELHSVDLDWQECTLEDDRGSVPIARIEDRPERETRRLRLARATAEGPLTLQIRYSARLRSDLRGFYAARSGTRRYALTQLAAADARRFFPCLDEPDKKARFQLSVTAPARLQVLSNAPAARSERSGHLRTTHFEPTPPLSSYLVALIVGELESSPVRRCGATPIRIWGPPGRRAQLGFALEAAAESLARLERYFGLPCPYPKLDLVAVPDFQFGAMENAGAVFFREALLLVDPKAVSHAELRRAAGVIAHELAHMWFGNLVTMAWWDDLWLNEAFATWMAHSIIDEWKPEWNVWLDFQRGRAAAFELDALASTHPIYVDVATPEAAAENFDRITYEKGAAVVRMVEHWLGRQPFRRGVRAYIRAHREGSARSADLWSALEKAAQQPIAGLVEHWTRRGGFPLVQLESEQRGATLLLRLRQQRFRAGGSRRGSGAVGPQRALGAVHGQHDSSAVSPQHASGAVSPQRALGAVSGRVRADAAAAPWPIPLCVRLRERGRRARTERALFDRSEQEIAIEGVTDVRWIYGNAGEAGFFRPLHGAAERAALRAAFHELDAAERTGLLDHQWAGVQAGQAPLAFLLELLPELAGEREPAVLEALLGGFGAWLRDPLLPALGAAAAGRVRALLRSVFGTAFRELGWQPRRGETPAARQRRALLLELAAGVGEDPELLEACAERVAAYLRDRHSLGAELAGAAISLAARSGSERLHTAYRTAARRAETPQERLRFHLSLADFRDPELVLRTLQLTLEPELRTQDVVSVLARLLANPAARGPSWDFIRGRWAELAARVPPLATARLVAALPLLGAGRRTEVLAFLRAQSLPAARRAIRQAAERFALDAELLRRTRRELRAWLADPASHGQ